MTNNIAKIRAALELANRGGELYAMNGLRQKSSDALAALAELEKAAAEPVAGEVTQEMCQRVAASFYGADTFANGVEMREALQLWRKELGPAMGLVEIRKPTAEDYIAISEKYADIRREQVGTLVHASVSAGMMREGRDIYQATRAVMWPKSEAK